MFTAMLASALSKLIASSSLAPAFSFDSSLAASSNRNDVSLVPAPAGRSGGDAGVVSSASAASTPARFAIGLKISDDASNDTRRVPSASSPLSSPFKVIFSNRADFSPSAIGVVGRSGALERSRRRRRGALIEQLSRHGHRRRARACDGPNANLECVRPRASGTRRRAIARAVARRAVSARRARARSASSSRGRAR